MSLRRVAFAVNEWYHCYNRGVEKRTIFEEPSDYERFLQLMYLANATQAVHRSNIYARDTDQIVTMPRLAPLVSIGAYCLMPNHFHLLIKEVQDNGITTFMQKLGTAYSMYFNIKYDHVGNLLYKPFRSRHIDDENYFQRAIRYIHLNPAELFEREWKLGIVRDMRKLENSLNTYRYSSLPDYLHTNRALRNILGSDGFDSYEHAPLKEILDDARNYYEELAASDAAFRVE